MPVETCPTCGFSTQGFKEIRTRDGSRGWRAPISHGETPAGVSISRGGLTHVEGDPLYCLGAVRAREHREWHRKFFAKMFAESLTAAVQDHLRGAGQTPPGKASS